METYSHWEEVGGWGYSSVVEHLTADQEVPGSNPGAPSVSMTFRVFLVLAMHMLKFPYKREGKDPQALLTRFAVGRGWSPRPGQTTPSVCWWIVQRPTLVMVGRRR